MNNQSNQDDDLNYLINQYNIDKNKYIIPPIYIDSYKEEDAIQRDNYDLICSICLNIINGPKSCSLNNISHSFCKKCIDKYLLLNNKCPICKKYFENKDNSQIQKLLETLSFKCLYQKEGCDKILSYSEYINHINKCNYNNILYECQIEKLNNNNKNFEKCKYKGYKKEIIKHFKLCAFFTFKCVCCNQNILKINLKAHIENECKFGIINYSNKEKFLGEKKNKIREGYGIYYFINGSKYEGEWKNGNIEGYGIISLSNGDK